MIDITPAEGHITPTPMRWPRRRGAAFWPGIGVAAAAGIAVTAFVGAPSNPGQAATPPPISRTATVATTGQGGLAAATYTDGRIVRLDRGVPFDATQVTAITVAAASATDGDATCAITVNGVVVDQAHGSGLGGQALCLWTPSREKGQPDA